MSLPIYSIIYILFLCLFAGCRNSGPSHVSALPATMTGGETLLPENQLDEDSAAFEGVVTREDFQNVMDLVKSTFKLEASQKTEDITIHGYWDSTRVNAGVTRIEGKVVISIYGGLARRSEITPGALALALCHEIGHAYGGLPYINPDANISAEGQADYFGAGECLKRVLPKLANDDGVADDIDREIGASCHADVFCERMLNASLRLSQLFAAAKNEGSPRIDTPDQSVTQRTILSYPKTAQCRLDTYYNATLSKQRPSCWFRQLDDED